MGSNVPFGKETFWLLALAADTTHLLGWGGFNKTPSLYFQLLIDILRINDDDDDDDDFGYFVQIQNYFNVLSA